MSYHEYKVSIERTNAERSKVDNSPVHFLVTVSRLGEELAIEGHSLPRLLSKVRTWILADDKTAE